MSYQKKKVYKFKLVQAKIINTGKNGERFFLDLELAKGLGILIFV